MRFAVLVWSLLWVNGAILTAALGQGGRFRPWKSRPSGITNRDRIWLIFQELRRPPTFDIGTTSNATISARSRQSSEVPNLMYQSCTTLNKAAGHCRPIQYCKLPELIKNIQTFRKYFCMIDTSPKAYGLCCPNPAPMPEPTPQEEDSSPTDFECGTSAKSNTRIVGGTHVRVGEFPWMVSLMSMTAYPNLFCGGVLISQRHVLTAAHCVNGRHARSSMWVRLGEHDYRKSEESPHIECRIANITNHPDFNSDTYAYDIALITLETPVQYNDHIRPVCLPPPEESFTGVEATVTGWGTTKFNGRLSSILNKVQVPVWSNEECTEALGVSFLDTSMCAGNPEGGKDACQDDSGGPLMVQDNDRWTLIGLVSWGVKCAMPNKPGVYTKVNFFLDWIENNAS